MSQQKAKKQKTQRDLPYEMADIAKNFLYGDKHIQIQDEHGQNLFQIYPVLLKIKHTARYRKVYDPEMEDYSDEKEIDWTNGFNTIIVRVKKWSTKKQQWGKHSTELKMEVISDYLRRKPVGASFRDPDIVYKVTLQPEGWEYPNQGMCTATLDSIVEHAFPNLKEEHTYETQRLAKAAVLKRLCLPPTPENVNAEATV